MATVRLTKKGLVILIILGLLIIGGGFGYLIWRLNQADNLGNEESSAGGNCSADADDGICNSDAGEDSTNCDDCPAICGDNACNQEESCNTCPGDCGTCAYCGDGLCNGGEICMDTDDEDGNIDECEDCGSCSVTTGNCRVLGVPANHPCLSTGCCPAEFDDGFSCAGQAMDNPGVQYMAWCSTNAWGTGTSTCITDSAKIDACGCENPDPNEDGLQSGLCSGCNNPWAYYKPIPDAVCNETCYEPVSDQNGLTCCDACLPPVDNVGVWRNPDCRDETDCICPNTPAVECTAKTVYRNDPANTAGIYYANVPITENDVVTPGEILLFCVDMKNVGDIALAPGYTDVIPSGLTVLDYQSGFCTFNSSTISCTDYVKNPNETGRLCFRATVNENATASITNSATVTPTDGIKDICAVTVNLKGTVGQPVCNQTCASAGATCGDGSTCQSVGGTLTCVNPTCPTESDCICPNTPAVECTAKTVYRNDPANTAGNYYANVPITENDVVTPGEILLFCVNYKNIGDVALEPGFTDVIPAGLTLLDYQEYYCDYNAGTLSCTDYVKNPNETGRLCFRATVNENATASITNSATVTPTDGIKDICAVTVNLKGTTPGTGLFDSTASKIALGVMLILIGGVYLSFDKYTTMIKGRMITKSRDKFEKGIIK